MDKYRVKSFYHKSYGSSPEVRYKIQKRVMGFWSDMDDNMDKVSMFRDILKDRLSLNTFSENFLYIHNTFVDDF